VSQVVERHLQFAITEENPMMFTSPMKTTVSTKGAMDDFATDDFLERNVRVMPGGSFVNGDVS